MCIYILWKGLGDILFSQAIICTSFVVYAVLVLKEIDTEGSSKAVCRPVFTTVMLEVVAAVIGELDSQPAHSPIISTTCARRSK